MADLMVTVSRGVLNLTKMKKFIISDDNSSSIVYKYQCHGRQNGVSYFNQTDTDIIINFLNKVMKRRKKKEEYEDEMMKLKLEKTRLKVEKERIKMENMIKYAPNGSGFHEAAVDFATRAGNE